MVDFPDMKELVEQYQRKQDEIVEIDKFKITVFFENSSVTFECATQKSGDNKFSDIIKFATLLPYTSEIFPFNINDKDETFQMYLILSRDDPRVTEDIKIVFAHEKERVHIKELGYILDEDYSSPISHAGVRYIHHPTLYYKQ